MLWDCNINSIYVTAGNRGRKDWGDNFLRLWCKKSMIIIDLLAITPSVNILLHKWDINTIIHMLCSSVKTHWGRVTHICVSKLTIIGSYNGLAPGRRQTIIWTNDGMLLIGPLGTNFSEILIRIQTFSFKKMHLKMSSAKWRPPCLGLNVSNQMLSTLDKKSCMSILCKMCCPRLSRIH